MRALGVFHTRYRGTPPKLCLSCCYVTPRATPFAQTHPCPGRQATERETCGASDHQDHLRLGRSRAASLSRFHSQSDHEYQFRRTEQLDVSPVQWASRAQGAQLLQRPDMVREASVVEPGLLSLRIAA